MSCTLRLSDVLVATLLPAAGRVEMVCQVELFDGLPRQSLAFENLNLGLQKDVIRIGFLIYVARCDCSCGVSGSISRRAVAS